MTFSRAEKYKKLRETFTTENEKTLSTVDLNLKQYEKRINSINPGILSPFSTPSSEDNISGTSQYVYRPFGSVSASSENKQPDFITAPHTAELSTNAGFTPKRSVSYPTQPRTPVSSANSRVADENSEQLFGTTDHSSHSQEEINLLTDSEKQQKKDSIRNELDKMLREDTDRKSEENQGYADRDQTASLIHETQQLRNEMLEYADGLTDVDDRLKGAHKMISITLWIVIIALVVILAAVYFMVFKMRSVL